MALVIKKWYASETPNHDGNYVHIVGREAGLFSWLLSVFKIDPITEIEVKEDIIKFTASSLAGKEKRIIPLRSITSAFYGYKKPWQMAVALTLLLFPVFFIGLIVGPVYYMLNKSLTVAVVESSSWSGAISFKRSVIEGQNINEEQAYQVIEIVRKVVEKKST